MRRNTVVMAAAPPIAVSAVSLVLLALSGPGPAIVAALAGIALIPYTCRLLGRRCQARAARRARE
jgi:hypothetical protein